MTANNIFTRSAVALGLSLAAGAVGHLYFTSNLYAGPRTDAIDANFFDLLSLVAVLVILKLFVYDLIASAILKKLPSSVGLKIFYTGYGLALAIDMLSIYFSFKPIYMNLSMLGTIMYSPVVLLITLVVLIVSSLVLHSKKTVTEK